MQERPLEVLGERRLPRDAAGLLDARRRGDDRLVGATLRAEGHPRRGTDQDRLAAGVDPERPRLVAAHQERVVDRPHREERLPVPRPGRPELAEQADEVDLRDPELDVLAVVRLAPAHERVGVVGEPVDPVSERPDPDPVDPAAEVGRRGDVGAHGDHSGRGLRRLTVEVGEQPAELLLGGAEPGVRATELDRQRRRLDRRGRIAAQALGRRRADPALGAPAVEAGPPIARGDAQLGRQRRELVRG